MAAWAITEWKEVKQPSLEPRRSTTCRQWHKPPRNFVKLIIDASFFSDSLQTGVGMVVHNEDGVFMNARTILHDELLRTDDGEAQGVLETVTWAVEMGFGNVVIETMHKWFVMPTAWKGRMNPVLEIS